MSQDAAERTSAAHLQRDGDYIALMSSLVRIFSESPELTPLVNRVLAVISDALKADVADIHLVQDGKLVLLGHDQRFLSPKTVSYADVRELPVNADTLAGRAVLSRRVQVAAVAQWPLKTRPIAEAMGIRHGMAAPLLVRERVFGSIYVLRRSEEPFSDKERALFELCAAQAALAIDHSQLFVEQREQVQGLRLILEVGQAITRSLELPEILESASVNMTRLSGGTHSFVWMMDAEHQQLRGAYASDTDQRGSFQQARINLDQPSLVNLALQTNAPVQVRDALDSPLVSAELLRAYPMRAMLAIPLLYGLQPMGAAVVGDCRGPRTFTDAEIERTMVMASQLAIAVANARLFEDLKASYAAMARAQDEFARRERLAALGELAAVVAHEVRNPLGVIYNSMSSLRRILKPTGEAEVLFNFVREEGERLDTIVSDLLDFARPREMELRQHPPETLITGAVKAVQAAAVNAKVDLRVRLPAALPQVTADERMIRQALINLLLNAVQAMPHGGVVEISGHLESDPPNASLRVDVVDSGPGIPRDLIEKVFQPFYTTKATGTGLGLAVVRRILEAHKGKVWVDTKRPSGACVSLRLPIEA